MDKKSLYLNDPQYLFAMVNPKEANLRWGRGTGKTFPIAFRMFNVVKNMPGSSNAFAVPSYQKFKKDFIANLRYEFERLGLREDRDWVIGKEPPRHWHKPLKKPDNYDTILSFHSGAIYSLFSQDGKTKNQGNNIASIIADECKLLNFERIKEDILNAMRGGADLWGNCLEYRSKLYTCDGYRREGDTSWFYDMEKRANPILTESLIRLALTPNLSEADKSTLEWARKNVFYYHKASAIENRHTLGLDYFKDAADNSTPMQYLVSMLNYDMNRIEGSFYIHLNEEKQGYYASNHGYWESLGYDASVINRATCLGDSDLIYSLPLDLSLDFGNTNFATVSQYDKLGNIIYLLKDFVERTYDEIINEFNYYYTPFKAKNRELNLWYDVSGNNKMQQSTDNDTYILDIKKKLESLGWTVRILQKKKSYIPHNIKFNIWKKVLYEAPDRESQYPIFRYNRVNAERTALSMGNAPQKDDRGVMKKDKTSEKDKKTPPEKATHLSDTIDNAVCFPLYDMYMKSVGKKPNFINMFKN